MPVRYGKAVYYADPAFRGYYLGNPENLSKRELLSILHNTKVELGSDITGHRWVQATGWDKLPKHNIVELIRGSEPLTTRDKELIKLGAHVVTDKKGRMPTDKNYRVLD